MSLPDLLSAVGNVGIVVSAETGQELIPSPLREGRILFGASELLDEGSVDIIPYSDGVDERAVHIKDDRVPGL